MMAERMLDEISRSKNGNWQTGAGDEDRPVPPEATDLMVDIKDPKRMGNQISAFMSAIG